MIADRNIDSVLSLGRAASIQRLRAAVIHPEIWRCTPHAHGNHDRFRGGDTPLFLPVIIDGRFSYSLSIHTAAISPENMTSST